MAPQRQPGAPPIRRRSRRRSTGDFETQRLYVEALTQSGPPCIGCHQAINPHGLRARELRQHRRSGRPPIARGGAIDRERLDRLRRRPRGGSRRPSQLAEQIANSPEAQQVYAKAWVAYAYGRPSNANDQCVVDTVKDKMVGAGYSILTLLADLTQSDSFTVRVRETPWNTS